MSDQLNRPALGRIEVLERHGLRAIPFTTSEVCEDFDFEIARTCDAMRLSSCALASEGALELRQCAEHMEHQDALRRRRVDSLGKAGSFQTPKRAARPLTAL